MAEMDRTAPPTLWNDHRWHWIVKENRTLKPRIVWWTGEMWQLVGTPEQVTPEGLASQGWLWHSPAIPSFPTEDLL